MALNDRGRVSAATKIRIQEIAKKHGYVPNAAGRALARKRSNIIGVVYFSSVHHMFSNVFYSVVLESFAEAMDSFGYNLLVARFGARTVGTDLPPFILDGTVDGVALIGPFHPDYLKNLSRGSVPTVLIDDADEGRKFDSVTSDNVGGAARAVSYLLQNGRRRILFLRTPGYIPPYDERYRGYLAAHKEFGLKVSKALFLEMQSADIPTRLISYVRQQKCDAVFCCNDLMAIVSMQHLRESGISVPEKMSVVGFDDIDQARMCAPPLTSVNVPKDHMGRRAAELLIHRLRHPDSETRQEVLPLELIVRDSVAPLPRARSSS